MTRNRIWGAISAALAGLALGAALVALESLPDPAYAQGHDSGGGHDGGAHEGGKGKGAGHDGGGHEAGGHDEKGGEHAKHGTRPGHEGHVSGQHGAASDKGRRAGSHGEAARRFGGGSGLSSSEAVPEGPGQHGLSAGPGPWNHLRYWGGRTIPEDLAPAATAIAVEDVPPGSGGGGGAGMGLNLSYAERCEGIGGDITPAQRIAGRNLARINLVHTGLVAPSTKPEAVGPFLLANFQEELEKAKPDYALAGVYFGTLAEQPVTAQVISKSASALCVQVNPEQAKLIASVAEAQRNEKSRLRITREQPAARGASATASTALAASSSLEATHGGAAGIAALAALQSGARVQTLTLGVLFPFDSAEPLENGKRGLDQLADALKDAKVQAVVAVGHADRIGPASYNERLSVRRAVAVRSYLAATGIDADKVTAEGRGALQPVTGDECRRRRGTALIACLQPDRRVQVEVRVASAEAR